ncbi:MAG: outer membrane lipoprotein carrier protein LolA [Syntrophaceae bacterium]|nr:outer membrane lipoprotein carrier protein LolA [Syntrophaceae bacterium]
MKPEKDKSRDERWLASARWLFILLCPLFIGWADNWAQIKEQSEKISTISARFTQKKEMSILAKPLLSEGRFYFKSPDSVRWEYMTPVRSILLMHHGDIHRYVKGEKGFIEDASVRMPGMKIVFQEITTWSKGRFDQNKSFSAVLKPGKSPMIILTPKEKGLADMIKRIEITLSGEKVGAIKTIQIIEGEKASTLLEFKDIELNRGIEDALFREVR